jgi:hypothetical protein
MSSRQGIPFIYDENARNVSEFFTVEDELRLERQRLAQMRQLKL